MPFKLGEGIVKSVCIRMNVLEHDDHPKDGFSWFCISDKIRESLNLPNHRQMRQQELHIVESTRESSISIGKIIKFSLRSPVIRGLIGQVGLYYRCFFYSKILDYTQFKSILDYNIYKCRSFDGLNHLICLQKRAFPEILEYFFFKMYVNKEILIFQ